MANHGNKIQKLGNHPPCFTETKSRKIFKILIWERHRVWFTETKSRQKYWVPGHNFFLWNFGNVTERVLRKQNPDHHFWKWNLLERILWIMMTNLFSTVINDWVRVRLFQLNSVIRYELLHMDYIYDIWYGSYRMNHTVAASTLLLFNFLQLNQYCLSSK